MRISDWSSDVCSSDLPVLEADPLVVAHVDHLTDADVGVEQVRALERGAHADHRSPAVRHHDELVLAKVRAHVFGNLDRIVDVALDVQGIGHRVRVVGEEGLAGAALVVVDDRSEEHTSELQSLMRISYAVFCLKKKKKITQQQ